MRILSTLERKTKEAIAPVARAGGLSTEPDPEMFTLADALAVDMPWAEFLAATQSITEQYIPLYVRIGELDPSEQPASDLLVAHEVALRAFARGRAGRGHGDVARLHQRAGPHALEPTGLRDG